MDDRGNIYAPGDPETPKNAVPIQDANVPLLQRMNRAARRAYFSVKRRGGSEADAMEAARAASRR